MNYDTDYMLYGDSQILLENIEKIYYENKIQRNLNFSPAI